MGAELIIVFFGHQKPDERKQSKPKRRVVHKIIQHLLLYPDKSRADARHFKGFGNRYAAFHKK